MADIVMSKVNQEVIEAVKSYLEAKDEETISRWRAAIFLLDLNTLDEVYYILHKTTSIFLKEQRNKILYEMLAGHKEFKDGICILECLKNFGISESKIEYFTICKLLNQIESFDECQSLYGACDGQDEYLILQILNEAFEYAKTFDEFYWIYIRAPRDVKIKYKSFNKMKSLSRIECKIPEKIE